MMLLFASGFKIIIVWTITPTHPTPTTTIFKRGEVNFDYLPWRGGIILSFLHLEITLHLENYVMHNYVII